MADLFEAGVKPDVLYKQIYQNDRYQKLKLMGRALESLELHCDGRLAVMTLLRSDFETTGARPDETENLVNEAMRIGGVEAAVILIENDHEIRVRGCRLLRRRRTYPGRGTEACRTDRGGPGKNHCRAGRKTLTGP